MRLVICFSVLLFATVVQPADRFVATTGVDAPGCLVPTAPCLTIGHALSEAADGDVIHIEAGTYVENVTVDRDVTFQGDTSGVTRVDGADRGSVFEVRGGVTANLNELTLVGGSGTVVPPGIRVGGGIQNNGGFVNVDNCTITNNTAEFGGGVNNDVGEVRITNTTISENDATGLGAVGGGGVYNFSAAASTTLVNSTVSGNSASGLGDDGAGLVNNDGQLTLFNCTVTANVGVSRGGGIRNFTGTVLLKNTIVAGNSAGNGPDCMDTLTSAGYNLIGDARDCTLVGEVWGNLLDTDPLLGPLADNGGPTLTHALGVPSPALDAGDIAGCTDAGGAPLTVDQRGESRPVDCGGGLRCDIGAFEACGAATPSGYCCDGTTCTVETEADCLAIPGATYGGDGTDCAASPCAPRGYCCDGTTCTVETEADCLATPGATYGGDGTDCAASPCAPRGYCCDGTTCTVETEADCLAIPGAIYGGDGSDCAASPCGAVGPTVFESTLKDSLGTPVGTATASPYRHTPPAAFELYYHLDDGTGTPDVIRLTKDGLDLLIYF